jgi:hypothetical protein
VAGRWAHIEKILGRGSPLANEGFEPDVVGVSETVLGLGHRVLGWGSSSFFVVFVLFADLGSPP